MDRRSDLKSKRSVYAYFFLSLRNPLRFFACFLHVLEGPAPELRNQIPGAISIWYVRFGLDLALRIRMLDPTETSVLTENMRILLATLLIAPEPLNIETAAVRSGLSLENARNSALQLLDGEFVQRISVGKDVRWQAVARPEVLSEVAFQVCKAYALVSSRSNIWKPKKS